MPVVFDLDDTLYPERAFALSGFRAASALAQARWGTPDLVLRMVELLDAGHLGALFRQVLEEHLDEPGDQQVTEFVDAYRWHEPDIALYDDAPAALAWARSLGPVGLITDGNHQVQKSKVRALGIESCFTSIVYTGAFGGREFHKPHPRGYEVAERELAVATDRFVYVGDNPRKDFVTPNARGWLSVQVRRTQGIHDADAVAPDGAPAHIIHSLAELPALVAAGANR